MHPRDREHTPVGLFKRRLHIGIAGNIALKMEERRDELQAVADAVIDLPQQQRPFICKRLEFVARCADLGLHPLLVSLDGGCEHGVGDRVFEQDQEIAVQSFTT